MRAVVWLKRDLRLVDHAPLARAAEVDGAVVLYIHEPEVLASPEYDGSHHVFINQCLAELRDELVAVGGQLLVQHGEATEVLDRLAEAWPFDELLSHEETGTWTTFERDRRVAAWCERRGVGWREFRQHGVFRGLTERDGWARRWRAHMGAPMPSVPSRLRSPPNPLRDLGLVDGEELGIDPSRKQAQAGGRRAALAVLDDFLARRAPAYATGMSSPNSAPEACSRLSPYFAWGALSVREAYQALEVRLAEPPPRGWKRPLGAFGKRLRWHCHFIQKLEREPRLEFENMSRSYDGLREEAWDEGRFQAWQEGRTGYPMVDACMRALRATGWINFRMRAMLVSFASYHLWLDWRPTSKWLGAHFLDFEPGIHFPQFQMQSGVTGINAIRVYSPAKQALDQDPDGVFIRTWVPELAGVPAEHIANPERMTQAQQSAAGCRIGQDYPAPIVDHATAYREARRRIGEVRRRQEAREEAGRVYDRHGSRKRPRPRVRKSPQGDLFQDSRTLETIDQE